MTVVYFEKKIAQENSFDRYAVVSATLGIIEILKKNNVRSISMPRFMCDDLVRCIEKADIDIHFYSIDEHHLPVLENHNKKQDCIYICNFYGGTMNERTLQSLYSTTKETLIILDWVHALFSSDNLKIIEKILKTHRAALIYSPRKYLGLMNGGLIYCNNKIKGPTVKQTQKSGKIKKNSTPKAILIKIYKERLQTSIVLKNFWRVAKTSLSVLNYKETYSVGTRNNKGVAYEVEEMDYNYKNRLSLYELEHYKKYRQQQIKKLTLCLKLYGIAIGSYGNKEHAKKSNSEAYYCLFTKGLESQMGCKFQIFIGSVICMAHWIDADVVSWPYETNHENKLITNDIVFIPRPKRL